MIANIIGLGFISGGKNYTNLSTPPVFTDTHTLIAGTVGPTVESGETNSKRELLIPNPYANQLIPNGLNGTSGGAYKFKSESDSVRSWVGGDVLTAGQQIISSLNNASGCEFYHLGLQGDSNSGVAGISAMSWLSINPATRQSIVKFNDIVVKDVSYAGALINSSTAGATYHSIDMDFIRIFGYNVDGEGLYIGNTGASESRITTGDYQHIFVYNKGREGIQFRNHVSLYVNKATCYIVGEADIAGQNNLVQVQNCNGTIENCIFYGAPVVMNVFAHGFTFRNCQFHFTSGTSGYIGRMASSFSGSPMLTNTPLVFEDCYFSSDTAITNMLTIDEDGCDISFIDCTKSSNITNLYLDNRADKVTYTLSNTGTTTLAPTTPTFNSLDPDNDNHGLVTSDWHYNLGLGYRTP